ncbi:hypothetical protein C7H19_11440 [Aphanothece hegewaldii CCALA 016]|uniref:Uncharacterized protein n=1 Tax=Aphanothece hegewaldii CCALA 016 TaxID=2107694 RepID=A0A2T1LY65_9CHRO|nr:hypothetical protein [Aphanothece hegewaldii]PSF37323.1 hypothetical protein C7H19_11440 [Aphanothece hegewaldii CCALA 016]
MNYDQSSHSFPAPCLIDFGTIINKDDIRRLLNDLGRVRYIHTLDGKPQSEGEGWIVEVFADPKQSTIVANHTLYLNVQSFDYLKLEQSPEKETYFDLVQDNRLLRLIPLSSPLEEQENRHTIDVDTLETMMNQVLSAKWDVQIDDDDEDIPF